MSRAFLVEERYVQNLNEGAIVATGTTSQLRNIFRTFQGFKTAIIKHVPNVFHSSHEPRAQRRAPVNRVFQPEPAIVRAWRNDEILVERIEETFRDAISYRACHRFKFG